MRGPMLIFLLMALFPMTLALYILFLAYLSDLTSLPVYVLLPLSPAYVLGFYLFGTNAKKSYREKKFKKFTALFFIAFLAFASPISVILAAIPNWNLTVTTDRLIYTLGENATITCTLTNNAYMAKSLESFYSSQLEIAVTNGSLPYQHVFMDKLFNISDWLGSVGARQSFQKTLIWQVLGGTGELTVRAYIAPSAVYNPYHLSDAVNITVTP